MFRATVTALSLLMLAALVVPGDSVSAQAAESPTSRFVGTWRVASWEHRFADGTISQDPKTVAFIMYSAGGRMCYVSMDPNRPLFESASSPMPAEAQSAFLAMGAYCARVEVNSEEGFVLHHVEVEKTPNNVGVTRRRFYEFRGPDELVLSVDPAELPAGQTSMTLVWRRISR